MTERSVAKFRSASRRSAASNLESFVADAKASLPFTCINWDDVRWAIASTARSSASHRVVGLVFARLSSRPKGKSDVSFPEPFASFVKAVVCKRAGRRVSPVSPSGHASMVRACRYIFESLASRANTPNDLVAADFDEAARLARRREAATTAYAVGNLLQELSEIIDEHGITPAPIGWVNTVGRADSHGGMRQSRIGDSYEMRRAKKLLSEAVLSAIAHLSSRDDLTDQDLLCQRVIDLLTSAPFRINELLTCPRNVWVAEVQKDEHGTPIVGSNGRPIVRYGLRYFPEKGGHRETQVKWLPTVMVDVARRAVDDILRITQPFADIAEVIYKQPGHTKLGVTWDKLAADHRLSLVQVAEVAGLQGRNRTGSASVFIRTHSIASEQSISSTGGVELLVRKGDVELALAKMSRAGNMFSRHGHSQPLFKGLFVVGVNYFGNRPLLNGTARPLTDQAISTYICGRAEAKSVFERYNYKDSAGQVLRATSHQFRHWLNTLALEGGLSEHVLARWSGRKRIADNAAYDHVSGLQMAREIREKLAAGRAIGPIPDYIRKIRKPVERTEFISTLVTTAHLTDLGGCLHDMTMDPCSQHSACANCPEHVIRKGDSKQRQRADELLRSTKLLVTKAESELEKGAYGANNWLAHHRRVAASLAKILAIHDDPQIPDGTIVYLRESEANPTTRKVSP